MSDWQNGISTALAAMSHWELLAVILAITYLLLAMRENILCWYAAFISTAIYTVIFWDVSLFMEAALNVYYMAMAVYGWWQWRQPDSAHAKTDTRLVAVWPLKTHLLTFGVIAACTIISGYLLAQNTEASWPYMDSFITWASVITTYMVAKKILENWLYWIVIDLLAIPLYIDRELYLTALLFVAYVVIAIFGYFSWRRHFQNTSFQNTSHQNTSHGHTS